MQVAMQTLSILFLDASPVLPPEFMKSLSQAGMQLNQVSSGAAAQDWLQDNICHGLLLSVPSGKSCGQLIQSLRQVDKSLPIVVAAGTPSVGDAVIALQAGASDYLDPPFSPALIERALKRAVLPPSSEKGGRESVPPTKGYASIIGESEKMKKVFSLIQKVSDADTTVLVRGESGTGKELVAQALHYEGARRRGPFVPVNCGAIPGELLESELFGHEKGAFTHAIRTRLGRFELADSGTVFLDEISEMSPMLQVKLLRVLQEKKFERIGGTRTITSDFRVVAATNRDLEKEVQEGRFREDLYYRLNVIPIDTPPLRERTGDIPLLLDYFIAKFTKNKKKVIKGIAPEAVARILRYGWPGNVRELENMVERMVILSAGSEITLEDLPERLLGGKPMASQQVETIPAQGFYLNDMVADFEKRLILQALDQTNWVKNRAAKMLNVNRTTLLEKMKRFKLSRTSDGDEE